MDRCFWEERLSGVSVYKNDQLLVSQWMKVTLDFSKISCNLVTEGSYINCSNKHPEEVKPKDQGFNKATEKIIDTTNIISGTGGLDIHLETCSKLNIKS
jgi:hypothetical protein